MLVGQERTLLPVRVLKSADGGSVMHAADNTSGKWVTADGGVS